MRKRQQTIPHIVIKQKDEFAQELGNRHGLYHAAQCYGWLCPCGHHSISAVGPVPNCASCRAANPARVFAERTKKRRAAAREQ